VGGGNIRQLVYVCGSDGGDSGGTGMSDKIIIALLATLLAGAMLYHYLHQTYNPAIIGYWQVHPVTMQLFYAEVK
jgi:uncharacterized membrane protein YedE/YeeE